MELGLVLDVVVAVLLAATIVYAALLNKRLQGLRANKAEFEAMVTEFNEATRRTEGAIQALRMAADQTGKALSAQVERAQALRDELGFLTSRADALADRAAGRAEAPPPKPAAPAAAAPRPAAAAPRPAAAAPAPSAPAQAAASTMPDEPEEGGRSKAERDLLKALRELR